MNLLTPDQLMLETFSPCVQTKFRIACDATNTVELELTEAKALISPARSPAGAKGLVQQSFSLIFHGPYNRFLPQGTCPMAYAHQRGYSDQRPALGKRIDDDESGQPIFPRRGNSVNLV